MFAPFADILTRKLKIVAYKTKGMWGLQGHRAVEEYQQRLKKSLLSPRTLSGSKTAYLNPEKEAYWALTVL